MLRQSARIRACEAAVSVDDFLSTDANNSESDEVWCCCGGREDGRLMLYCDKQCEGCNIWYHYDCIGLSLSDGQRLGASQVVCPFCVDNSTPSHASPVPGGSAPQ